MQHITRACDNLATTDTNLLHAARQFTRGHVGDARPVGDFDNMLSLVGVVRPIGIKRMPGSLLGDGINQQHGAKPLDLVRG